MKEKNNKINCHSRVSLLGISTLIKQSGGDPRLQASGMTNGKINSHSRVFLSGISTLYPSPVAAEGRGFTLVELLITIIIVGVLAAIAVSAYQKAVLKSRFSSVIPPTKTIADAQEFHYMNEGSYATDTEDLDVKLNSGNNTITLSDKRTYKYVMGTPDGAENNHYIMYQKHSKRFANDIHCEAQKDDARANWLCETGLGGTRIDGSISGSNWLTYLLSGEGNGKFIREDCPAGYYDKNGKCTIAPVGYYAEDGEIKGCEAGTYQDKQGATSCKPCPVGTYGFNRTCYVCQGGFYNDTEGNTSCKYCPDGTYQPNTAATSCNICPPGTYSRYTGWGSRGCNPCPAGKYAANEGSSSCAICPNGTYQSETGATSCNKCPPGTYSKFTGFESSVTSCTTCPAGQYTATEGSSACQKCPSGTTPNEDHTACI